MIFLLALRQLKSKDTFLSVICGLNYKRTAAAGRWWNVVRGLESRKITIYAEFKIPNQNIAENLFRHENVLVKLVVLDGMMNRNRRLSRQHDKKKGKGHAEA